MYYFFYSFIVNSSQRESLCVCVKILNYRSHNNKKMVRVWSNTRVHLLHVKLHEHVVTVVICVVLNSNEGEGLKFPT